MVTFFDIICKTNTIPYMKHVFKIAGNLFFFLLVFLLSYLLPSILLSISLDLIIDFNPSVREFIASILGILFFYFTAKLYVHKILKSNLKNYHMDLQKPEMSWCLLAIAVPILLVLFYYLTGNVELRAQQSTPENTILYFSHLIAVGGLTAAFIEEFFFRGLLLRYLEKIIGYKWAIIIPSVIFASLHLFSLNDITYFTACQLVISISIIGIILALIAYYTKNIWNTILIHFSWNVITSIMIAKSDPIESNLIFQFTNDNPLLTGGSYGVDIGIPALLAFLIFGFFLYRKQISKLSFYKAI